jgi:hypothetical protein
MGSLLFLLALVATAVATWTTRSLLNAAAATRRRKAERERELAARTAVDLDRLAMQSAKAARGDEPHLQRVLELGHTLLGLRMVGQADVARALELKEAHRSALERARDLEREADDLLEKPLRTMLRLLGAALRKGVRHG